MFSVCRLFDLMLLISMLINMLKSSWLIEILNPAVQAVSERNNASRIQMTEHLLWLDCTFMIWSEVSRYTNWCNYISIIEAIISTASICVYWKLHVSKPIQFQGVFFFFKVAGKSFGINEGVDALKRECLSGEYEKSICQERKDELRINSKLDSDYEISTVCRNVKIH